MKKPILCLDFDGVIHSYASGWKGADVIPDPPVPGALDFIIKVLPDFEVHIFSSRSSQPGGRLAMQEWLIRHFEEALKKFMAEELAVERARLKVLQSIKWPTEKPPAFVTIDDRAITFTGIWPTLSELQSFKPWNKR
jgi:hypothetical protein